MPYEPRCSERTYSSLIPSSLILHCSQKPITFLCRQWQEKRTHVDFGVRPVYSADWFWSWHSEVIRVFSVTYSKKSGSLNGSGSRGSVVCLRHYVISRKVVSSSPDEIIGFFNWPNPSSRTMVLGSTQPLTEMSTRNLPGGVKGDRCIKLTNLSPSVSRLCEPRRLTTLWPSAVCHRNSFTFFVWLYVPNYVVMLIRSTASQTLIAQLRKVRGNLSARKRRYFVTGR
jgi:hypothetical protein